MTPITDYPEILKTKDMCELYRCSPKTLRNRVREGEVPSPLQVGKELIWPKWTVEEHLGYKRTETTPDQSIDQIRDRARQELADELIAMLTPVMRKLSKGVPNGLPV